MGRLPSISVGSPLGPRPFTLAKGGKKPIFKMADGTRANVRQVPGSLEDYIWEDGLVTDYEGNPVAAPVRDESGAIVGYVDRDGKSIDKSTYDVVAGITRSEEPLDNVAASDPANAPIEIPDVVVGDDPVTIEAPSDPKVAASAPEVEAAPNIQALAVKINDLGGSILNKTDEANQQFINQVADEIMRQYDASGKPSPQMQLLLSDDVMKERLEAIVSRADDSPGAPPSTADEGVDPYTGETPDQRGERRLRDEEQKISRQGAYAIPGNKRRKERLKELGLAAREAPLAQKPRYERKPPIQKETGPIGPRRAGSESQTDTAAQMARTAAGFSGDPRARGNVPRGIEERAAAGEASLINPVTGSIDTTPESAVPGLEDSRSVLTQQLEAVRRKQQLIIIGNRKGTLSDADADAAMRPLMEERAGIEQALADVNQQLRGIVPDSGISGVISDPATVTLDGTEIEDLAAGRVGSRKGLPQKISDSRRRAALRTLAQEGRGTAMVPSKEVTLINDGETPVAAMSQRPDFLWEKKRFQTIKDKKTGKMRDFDPKTDAGREKEIKMESRWVSSWNPNRGESPLVQRPVRYDMPIEWFVGDGPGLQSADEFVKHIAQLGGYHDVLMKSPLAQDAIRQMMDIYLLPDSPIYGNRDLFRSTGAGGPGMGDWIPEGQTADDVFDELGRMRNPVPLLGDSPDGPDPRFTAPGMRKPPSYEVDQLVSMREQLARQREALVDRADADGADDLIPRAEPIREQIREIDARIRAATGGGPNAPSPTMELSPEQMDHFRDALATYNENWAAASDWIGDPVDAPKAGGRRTMGEFDAQAATDAARQASPDSEDALPSRVDREALRGAGYANLPYFPTASDISTRRGGRKAVAAAPAIPTVVDAPSTPGDRRRKLIADKKAAEAGGTTPTPPPGIPGKVDGSTPTPPPQIGDMEIDDELERYYRDWFASNFPSGSPAFPDFESWWAKSGPTVSQDPAARRASAARLSGSTPAGPAAPAGGATPASPGATPAGPTPAAGGGGAGSPPPPNIPATPAGATPAAPGSPAPGPTPGNAAANNLAQAWGAPQQGPPPPPGGPPGGPPTPPRRLRDLLTWRNAAITGAVGAVGAIPTLIGLKGSPNTAEELARLDGMGDPLGPPGSMPPGGFPPVGGGDGFSDPLANDRAAQMARALQLMQEARVPRYQTAQNFTGGTYYR